MTQGPNRITLVEFISRLAAMGQALAACASFNTLNVHLSQAVEAARTVELAKARKLGRRQHLEELRRRMEAAESARRWPLRHGQRAYAGGKMDGKRETLAERRARETRERNDARHEAWLKRHGADDVTTEEWYWLLAKVREDGERRGKTEELAQVDALSVPARCRILMAARTTLARQGIRWVPGVGEVKVTEPGAPALPADDRMSKRLEARKQKAARRARRAGLAPAAEPALEPPGRLDIYVGAPPAPGEPPAGEPIASVDLTLQALKGMERATSQVIDNTGAPGFLVVEDARTFSRDAIYDIADLAVGEILDMSDHARSVLDELFARQKEPPVVRMMVREGTPLVDFLRTVLDGMPPEHRPELVEVPGAIIADGVVWTDHRTPEQRARGGDLFLGSPFSGDPMKYLGRAFMGVDLARGDDASATAEGIRLPDGVSIVTSVKLDAYNPPRGVCTLCGLFIFTDDPTMEGHGLGDCVDMCETCGGSGDGPHDPVEGTLACTGCGGRGYHRRPAEPTPPGTGFGLLKKPDDGA